MGIRDYLKEWVEPYDAIAGWSPGDEAITTQEMRFSNLVVPKGARVVIDCIPECRHGAGLYDLGTVNYTDPETGEVHEGLECALSCETAEHHFGESEPGIRKA